MRPRVGDIKLNKLTARDRQKFYSNLLKNGGSGRSRRQRIREKEIAMGHKTDDHEDSVQEQGWGMSMIVGQTTYFKGDPALPFLIMDAVTICDSENKERRPCEM